VSLALLKSQLPPRVWATKVIVTLSKTLQEFRYSKFVKLGLGTLTYKLGEALLARRPTE
jgi:hypothetical protein